MHRNTLVRLAIYPVAVALAGGMLWLWMDSRREAQAESLATQAYTEIGLGLLDQAELSAREAVRLDPSSAAAWSMLGEVLGRAARRDPATGAARRAEAAGAFAKSLELGDATGARLEQLADSATKAGLLDIAENAADRSITIHGATPSALWMRGRARWLAAADDPAARGPAREDLTQSCRSAPDDELPAQIAALAMMFNDDALATVAATRMEVVAPEEPEGPAIAAWLAERSGDTAAALAAYDLALTRAKAREKHRPAGTLSQSEARRRFIAELFYRRGGLRFAQDRASAAPDLDNAFRLNPESPVVALLTAQARLAAKRPADAATALERAWSRAAGREALRAEIVTQVRAGDWDGLPASPFRDALHAAAKQ